MPNCPKIQDERGFYVKDERGFFYRTDYPTIYFKGVESKKKIWKKKYVQRKYFKRHGIYIFEEKVLVTQNRDLCTIGRMHINVERKGELD